MLKIYVAQQLIGKNLIDVSLKSGLYIFKPPTDYYKNVVKVGLGLISYKDLTFSYRQQMRESYRKNKDLWEWFLHQNTVIFGCDCGKKDKLCHAFYLANNIFTKFKNVEFLGWKDWVEN